MPGMTFVGGYPNEYCILNCGLNAVLNNRFRPLFMMTVRKFLVGNFGGLVSNF